MKKSILSLLTLFSISHLFAQTDLALTYNAIHSGRSINFTASKKLNEKNEIGLGLIYNINKLAHDDDQNNIYKKRLYAVTFGQHFGIETFYHRRLTDKWEKTFEPYLFYDLQLKRSTTRTRTFWPYTYDTELQDYLYKESINYWGPFTWVENNIGVGFKAKINNQFYITQKIGAGANFILGNNNKDYYKNDYLIRPFMDWELGMLIQTGLVYRIESKSKTKP